MNARILELERAAAIIKKTIISLARESFNVNGWEVRINYLLARGSIIAIVGGKQVSEAEQGYGSKLIAADICKACGVTDPSILHDVTVRVTLAMGL